jgi:hypothetical protein
MIDCM